MASQTVLLNGSLDLDDSIDVLPNGFLLDAYNTTILSSESGFSSVRSTLDGNRPFIDPLYTPPAGFNKTIGAYADNLRNRVIDFLYNSLGSNQVRIWDFNKNRCFVLVSDANGYNVGGKILSFNVNNRIRSCFILYRDPSEGDLLFFNDGINRPFQINIDKTLSGQGMYGRLSANDIQQIKRPPLYPPTGGYSNDVNHNANNLKSKQIQFAYRYVYDDYSVSTYSPWSKVFIPSGSTDPNVDTIPTNNNFIQLSLGHPYNMVVSIEVIARFNEASGAWGAPVLIKTITVSYPLSPSYVLSFYNDGVYTPCDIEEVAMLFTNAPDKSMAQALINENVLYHAGITEGYNYSDVSLNVSMSSALEDAYNSSNQNNTQPVQTSDVQLTWIQYNGTTAHYTVTYVGKEPIVGNLLVTVNASIRHHGSFNSSYWSTWTLYFTLTASQPSQTISQDSGSQIDTGSIGGSILSVVGNKELTESVFFSTPKYDWWAHYQWGLVYYDQNGKTHTVYTNDTMSLYMPAYFFRDNGYGGEIVQTPYINASINHTPPSWAASYAWVRSKNLSEDFALYWITSSIITDANYIYINIDNLLFNFTNVNQGTNYNYGFVKGDRCRIFYYPSLPGGVGTQFSYANNEYSVVSVIESPKAGSGDFLTGFNISNPGINYSSAPNVVITGDGNGAKAHAIVNNGQITSLILDSQGQGYTYASITFSGGGGANAAATPIIGYYQGTFIQLNIDNNPYPNGYAFIKLYRPAKAANGENEVFYEFGETYPIITDSSGNLWHGGMLQNQSATQPATFKFTEGDYFFTNMHIPDNILVTPVTYYGLSAFMAMNYDDHYLSSMNSNGRSVSVFAGAKRLFYPTLYRYSEPYLLDTKINRLSLFIDNSQGEYDRSFGTIKQIAVRQNYIRIFQEKRVGRVPVRQSVIQTASGNNILAQSEKLLGNIQYDESIYGIGDGDYSLASLNYADYFADTINGVICRASNDGVDPISTLYKTASYFNNYLKNYSLSVLNGTTADPSASNSFFPVIQGSFDSFRNEYVVTLEAVDRWSNGVQVINLAADMIGFSERDNGFKGRYAYASDKMVCLNNMLCSFYDGLLYTHDNINQGLFFGVQYDSYLEIAVNQDLLIDKSYLTLQEITSNIWWCDLINTSLSQTSNIPSGAFSLLEGKASAPFFRDINSSGGIVNGTPLKGKWMTIRFRITPNKGKEYFTAVRIKYNVYP